MKRAPAEAKDSRAFENFLYFEVNPSPCKLMFAMTRTIEHNLFRLPHPFDEGNADRRAPSILAQ